MIELSPVSEKYIRFQKRLSYILAGTVWLLMITACLCTGIAFVVVTTVKSIRSKNGYILTEKPATASEDEGVSKPVQEVCGKCDQPIDV